MKHSSLKITVIDFNDSAISSPEKKSSQFTELLHFEDPPGGAPEQTSLPVAN